MGGRGDDYADFLEETVREKVRDLYGEPWPSGVMGSSLGGLISLHIADDTDSSDNYCENVQLRDALVGTGYRLDQDLFYFWDADAPHNEAAWGDHVWRPFAVFSALCDTPPFFP